MLTTPALFVLCVLTTYGGGVTETSGVKQFWTDDFNVFEQVYGKTSDKDLYGATLPPTITFSLDVPKSRAKVPEKRERFLTADDIAISEQRLYPYAFGDRYAKLFDSNVLQPEKETFFGFKFVGVDSKPISESSDPETYNYLKRLEKQQKLEFPDEGIGGFTPYIIVGNAKTLEDTDAYKSIQDILDAHEANKNGQKFSDEEHDKYLRYGTYKSRSEVTLNSGNSNKLTAGLKSRCRSGRCRKRNSSSYHFGARPYLRRTKYRRISHR